MTKLFVDPILPTLLVIAILLLSLAACLWIEFRRNFRFKALSIISIVCLHIALAGLFLKPYYKVGISDSLIILTAGFDAAQLDSMLETNPGSRIFSYDVKSTYDQISKQQLIEKQSQIAFVLGYGFSRGVLDQMNAAHFIHLPKNVPQGVLKIFTKNEVISGEATTVQVLLNHERKEAIKVVLEGPEGKIDSAEIGKSGVQRFKLNLLPKSPGDWIYTLRYDKSTISFPIHVEDKSALKVLLLQQFPTFETRSLKEFLEAEHRIAARYQTSQNVFRYENINDSEQRFTRLTREVLQRYDLVILDTDLLKTISSSERKALQDEIRNGLGLIVLFNESPVGNNKLSDLSMNFKSIRNDTASFSVDGKLITLPAWPATAGNDVTPVVKNKSRTLVGFTSAGFGKIGFQLLQETYQLALRGDSLSYRSIWSELIDRTARKNATSYRIDVGNEFPIDVDEPVHISLVTNESTPTLYADSIRVPLAEDVVIDGIWKTKAWFNNPGWHYLKIDGDTTTRSVFISKKNEAPSISHYNRMIETTRLSTGSQGKSNVVEKRKDFPTWIFFGVILLCCGCLWLLPKL